MTRITIITMGTAIMDRLRAPICLCALLLSLPAAAHMEDDPLLFMLRVDELEWSDAEGDPMSWDLAAWIGRDLHKFHLRNEGERGDAGTESLETQALYSRAVAPYWDLQLGLRRDAEPGNGSGPARDWAVLGIAGLAPYWFEIEAGFFIGENGRTALRLEAEYEILFTQKLILTPEIEFNFYGKDDPESGIGSGLSDIETGLRLRYEIRREFAPYIGFEREKLYGKTANLAQAVAEDTGHSGWVAGLKFWF
jgi:copper resistance protein B